jgi:DNA replication and repair protein RecF
MKVQKLRLQNFRSYEKAELTLGEDINVLIGANGQGKTNLLESLVFLSLTRSHRVNDDRLLIHHGSPYAEAACTVIDGREKQLRVLLHSQGKSLFLNGIALKRSSDFIGQLNVVLFAPDSMRLYHDAPRQRRRLLDQEIGKVHASYVQALNRYHSLLKDRNAFLKSEQKDERYMEILDAQMAQEEETIIRCRRAFMEKIQKELPEAYRRISGSEEKAGLQYMCCCTEGSREALVRMHQASRERDAFNKAVTVGVHREDMSFLLNDRPAAEEGSQGQQRMEMLAFKLSILKYIEQETGERAVLLLDDVFSELDETRQQSLMETIRGRCQVLITATQLPPFLKERNPRVYVVDQGRVQEKM